MQSKKKIEHFTDLTVWQKSHDLFLEIYRNVERFPRTGGARVIADQILRSTSSISANIAEGFKSISTKQYVYFLDIAQRSAAETENWVYKMRDCQLTNESKSSMWLNACIEVEKMLYSLIKSLKAKVRTTN
jgi:four helix bundle protein